MSNEFATTASHIDHELNRLVSQEALAADIPDAEVASTRSGFCEYLASTARLANIQLADLSSLSDQGVRNTGQLMAAFLATQADGDIDRLAYLRDFLEIGIERQTEKALLRIIHKHFESNIALPELRLQFSSAVDVSAEQLESLVSNVEKTRLWRLRNTAS